MILAIDIGNTNIKYGIFSGDKLSASFRVSSNLTQTGDEYGSTLINLLASYGVGRAQIEGIIISSVIPSLNYTMVHMCEYYLGKSPLMVGAGTKTGLNIKTDNPLEVGADRVANCVAGIKKYNTPLIIVDFGTATTFNVVTNGNEFIGGVIAPGIKPSMEALVSSTAKLPRFELERPKEIIAKNTISNMQAGFVFGFAGMTDYIIKKIKSQLGTNAFVVATGGFSQIVEKEIDCIDKIDRTLTLDGLNYIYCLNTENTK